jgi:ubiquitin C-terminal hydrolase
MAGTANNSDNTAADTADTADDVSSVACIVDIAANTVSDDANTTDIREEGGALGGDGVNVGEPVNEENNAELLAASLKSASYYFSPDREILAIADLLVIPPAASETTSESKEGSGEKKEEEEESAPDYSDEEGLEEQITSQWGERSIMDDAFGLTLCGIVECAQCGHVSRTLDKAFDLSLEISDRAVVQESRGKGSRGRQGGGGAWAGLGSDDSDGDSGQKNNATYLRKKAKAEKAKKKREAKKRRGNKGGGGGSSSSSSKGSGGGQARVGGEATSNGGKATDDDEGKVASGDAAEAVEYLQALLASTGAGVLDIADETVALGMVVLGLDTEFFEAANKRSLVVFAQEQVPKVVLAGALLDGEPKALKKIGKDILQRRLLAVCKWFGRCQQKKKGEALVGKKEEKVEDTQDHEGGEGGEGEEGKNGKATPEGEAGASREKAAENGAAGGDTTEPSELPGRSGDGHGEGEGEGVKGEGDIDEGTCSNGGVRGGSAGGGGEGGPVLPGVLDIKVSEVAAETAGSSPNTVPGEDEGTPGASAAEVVDDNNTALAAAGIPECTEEGEDTKEEDTKEEDMKEEARGDAARGGTEDDGYGSREGEGDLGGKSDEVEQITQALAQTTLADMDAADTARLTSEVYLAYEPPEKIPAEGVDRFGSVQSCLNNFTKSEQLLVSTGDGYGCEKCARKARDPGLKVDARKRVVVWEPPKVLVVHLKRFRQTARGKPAKIDRDVAAPPVLDLKDICMRRDPAHAATCADEDGKGDDGDAGADPLLPARLYDLYGVVEHSGGLGGGHYVAHVQVRPEGAEKAPAEWHYASDTSVSRASEASALSAQAFLLFYERRD